MNLNLAPPAIPPRARSRPAGTKRTETSDAVEFRKGSAGSIETPVKDQVGIDKNGMDAEQERRIAGLMAALEVDSSTTATKARRNEGGNVSPESNAGRGMPQPRQRAPSIADPISSLALGLDDSSPSLSSQQSDTRRSEPQPQPQLQPRSPSHTRLPSPPPPSSSPNDQTTINLGDTPQPRQTTAFSPASALASPETEKKQKVSASTLVIPRRSTSKLDGSYDHEPLHPHLQAQPRLQPGNDQEPPTLSSSSLRKSSHPNGLPTSSKVSPHSSPNPADGYITSTEPRGPTLGHAFQSSGIERAARRRSSDLDASSMTTGTSVFPSPTVTPPAGSPFGVPGLGAGSAADLGSGSGSGSGSGLASGSGSRSGSIPDMLNSQGLPMAKPQPPPPETTTSSSGSFFKRPYPILPSSSSASLHSMSSQTQNQGQSGSKGSTTPSLAGGYVNARMAREEERKTELDQKQKRERESSKGGTATGMGRDGYKIVDGVEKKQSASGVYTPATFPGPSGKKSRTPSMTSQNGLATPKTPESMYSFQTSTPPPVPESASSSYFTRGLPLSSPNRGGGGMSPRSYSNSNYAGSDGSVLGKKRSIIGALKSPSFTGVRTAMSDGWRRSSADAAPGQSHHDDSVYPAGQSIGLGMRMNSGFGLDVPPDRSRSVSDQIPYVPTYRRQASREGVGLGFGEDLTLRGRSSQPGTEPSSEVASARASLDGSTVPPPTPGGTSNTRPRNVKNLSLPLSNMHGVAEQLEERIPPTPLPEPFSPNAMLGAVAKGVRRKPVPQS